MEKLKVKLFIDKDNKIIKFQLKDKRKVNNHLIKFIKFVENVVID